MTLGGKTFKSKLNLEEQVSEESSQSDEEDHGSLSKVAFDKYQEKRHEILKEIRQLKVYETNTLLV